LAQTVNEYGEAGHYDSDIKDVLQSKASQMRLVSICWFIKLSQNKLSDQPKTPLKSRYGILRIIKWNFLLTD